MFSSTFLPSIFNFFVAKEACIVDKCLGLNLFSTYLNIMDDFPTAPSPSRTTLKRASSGSIEVPAESSILFIVLKVKLAKLKTKYIYITLALYQSVDKK